MQVIITVAPVFFMLGLGLVARRGGWVTPEQEAGLKAVVFNVLFPIMVFNALFTTELTASMALVVAFMLAVQLGALAVGTLAGRHVAGRHASVARYLMATSDGGNACYPLCAMLLGADVIGDVVLLDLATIVVTFLVIPLMVSAQAGGESDGEKPAASLRSLLARTAKSPTVIALVAGLALALLGVYAAIDGTAIGELYDGVASTATQAIVPMVLFTLGFDFEVDARAIAPLLRTLAARICYMAAAGALFCLAFPGLAQDQGFLVTLVVYLMAPPAFAMPGLVGPACADDADRGFVSAFVSLNMVWTVIVFTVVAALVA